MNNKAARFESDFENGSPYIEKIPRSKGVSRKSRNLLADNLQDQNDRPNSQKNLYSNVMKIIRNNNSFQIILSLLQKELQINQQYLSGYILSNICFEVSKKIKTHEIVLEKYSLDLLYRYREMLSTYFDRFSELSLIDTSYIIYSFYVFDEKFIPYDFWKSLQSVLYSTNEVFDIKAVTMINYGTKNFTKNFLDDEYLAFKSKIMYGMKDEMSDGLLSSFFFSVTSYGDEIPLGYYRALYSNLQQIEYIYDTKSIYRIFDSLRHFTDFDDDGLVHDVLELLIKKLGKTEISIDLTSHIVCSLAGFMNKSIPTNLFPFIISNLNGKKDEITSSDISAFFYGLKNLGELVVTNDYIDLIVKEFIEFDGEFNYIELSMILIGISSLSNDTISQDFFRAYYDRLVSLNGKDLNGYTLGSIVFGLKNYGLNENTYNILSYMFGFLKSGKVKLSVSELTSLVIGFMSFGNEYDISDILGVYLDKIKLIKIEDIDVSKLSFVYIGLINLMDYPQVVEIINYITNIISIRGLDDIDYGNVGNIILFQLLFIYKYRFSDKVSIPDSLLNGYNAYAISNQLSITEKGKMIKNIIKENFGPLVEDVVVNVVLDGFTLKFVVYFKDGRKLLLDIITSNDNLLQINNKSIRDKYLKDRYNFDVTYLDSENYGLGINHGIKVSIVRNINQYLNVDN